MTTNISSYFADILHERESLIIPGFGGLITSYRAASIDHVQGLLHPPSRLVRFDQNLQVNDGVLIAHLQKEAELTSEEARSQIDHFVAIANERLVKREILMLPGVGRLYKDHEGRFKFLQDNTNFNKESYGLQSVQYYPILRNKETAPREAPLPDTFQSTPTTSKKRAWSTVNSPQTILSLMVGFALLALAGTFIISKSDTNNIVFSSNNTLPVSDKRVNEKPTFEDITTMSVTDSRNGNGETTSTVISEEEKTLPLEEIDANPEIDIEDKILGPSRKKGVIIIGSYKFKRSIQKMADKVVAQGFNVYQQRIGDSDIIRVGAQFAYEDQKDLNRKLRIIKDNIEDRAWILVQ